MKKIAHITIQDHMNFGNRLQAYAIHKLFEPTATELFEIDFNGTKPQIPMMERFAKLRYLLKYRGLSWFMKAIAKRLRKNDRLDKVNIAKQKEEKSKEFTSRFIPQIELKSIEDLKHFDCTIFGSDQIFHPLNRLGMKTTLGRNSDNRKFAFSASFGTNSFTRYHKKMIVKYLPHFEGITLREPLRNESLSKTVSYTVLPDPTILLPKSEWDELVVNSVRKSMTSSSKYVVCYFIEKRDPHFYQSIKEFAQKNSLALEVIVLNDYDYPQHYAISPDEFVAFISTSECVFTDSFHGSVFAGIYAKDLYFFQKNKLGLDTGIDRIKSLFALGDGDLQINTDINNLGKSHFQIEVLRNMTRGELKNLIRKIAE